MRPSFCAAVVDDDRACWFSTWWNCPNAAG